MKQPVWVLNSSLLVLFFISQLLLFMIQRAVPRRASINPGKVEVVAEQTTVPVDIAKIYQQDLFGTYELPPIQTVPSFVEETVAAIPTPPSIIIPEVPIEKSPTFFAPLDVILKGVIFVKDDAASCIAIVQLKKTKEERNYQVGDLIEDAQILKILSNRIIIIRSNGQQETLYLREEDAISDFNTEAKSAPKTIVEDVSEDKYTVNIDEFTKRVRNLGEFINLLDLTTVYKRGKSFGCRVGRIEKESLGAMLGFVMDDIIAKVDDYYVDDLANRIQLYNHIIQKRAGDVIEVVLHRGQDVRSFQYGLVDNISKSIIFTPQQTHQKLLEELHKHESIAQQDSDNEKVIIQSLFDDEKADEASMTSVEDLNVIDTTIPPLNFDEALWANENEKQQKTTSSNQSISNQIEQAHEAMQSLQQAQKLDKHQKRLLQERDKLSSSLHSMKSKDKNNMMNRTSKNVIFSGIQ